MNMTTPVEQPEEAAELGRTPNWGGLLSIGDIINMYRRNWLVMVGILTICMAAAIAAALILPKRYEATARILIDPGQQQEILQTNQQSDNFQSNQARVDTQVQVMQSQDLAQAVVRALRLDRDPEFQPTDADGVPVDADDRVEMVAGNVSKGLTVRRNGTSFIVDISFTSHSPEKTTRIANAFAQGFVALSAQSRSQGSAQTSQFLQQQMAQLNSKIQSKEAQIAQYKARAGIAQGGDSQTVTDQQIGPISAQLANAEAAASKANADRVAGEAQVRSGDILSVSGVLNSSVITQLRNQRALLTAQAAEISKRYGPNHPDRIQIQEQIASVDALIEAEANRIVSRLRADAQAASQTLAQLRGALSNLKSQQAANVNAAVIAQKLERENAADREVYERAAAQAQQQGQQSAAQQPVGTIIQAAVLPDNPVFPSTKLFTLAGLFSGFLLGSVTVFALDSARKGLRTPEEMRALGLRYLASVPKLDAKQLAIAKEDGSAPARYVVLRPTSAIAEVFRILRVELDNQPIAGNRGRVMVVLSALPGEGKSFISQAMSQVAAVDGIHTLVIDCDRRRPQLSSTLKSEVKLGLDDVLAGKAKVEDAWVQDPESGLTILPWRQTLPSVVDIFAGDDFKELIDKLTAQFDLIVLDSPPVLGVSDARRLASVADVVLLAIEWSNTDEGAITAAIDQLRRDHVPLVGGVFSQVKPKAFASLSKTDPIYYQTRYTKYYTD